MVKSRPFQVNVTRPWQWSWGRDEKREAWWDQSTGGCERTAENPSQRGREARGGRTMRELRLYAPGMFHCPIITSSHTMIKLFGISRQAPQSLKPSVQGSSDLLSELVLCNTPTKPVYPSHTE